METAFLPKWLLLGGVGLVVVIALLAVVLLWDRKKHP